MAMTENRKAKLLLRVHELIENKIRRHVRENVVRDEDLLLMIDKIYKRQSDPYRVADKITRQIIKSRQ